VRVGTRVVFGLSRNIGGVWYPESYGRLSTHLVLQKHVGEATDAARRWITVGQDGAGDVREGPSIGHANVAVGHLFREPGIYPMRGIIHTIAQPLNHVTPKITPDNPQGVVARDIVYVTVRVLGPNEEDLSADKPSPGPNAVYTEPMPKQRHLKTSVGTAAEEL